MGCFGFKCSLTGTAISEDEKVLLVVVNPDILLEASTHSLSYNLHGYERTKDETYNPVLYVGVGKYDDYGWIKDCPIGDRDIIQEFKPNERELGDEDLLGYYFMCHLEAVEKVLNIKLEEGEIKEPVELLQKLCSYAHKSRTELFLGFCPIGKQHEDDEEINLKLKQLEITQEILERHLQEYKSYQE